MNTAITLDLKHRNRRNQLAVDSPFIPFPIAKRSGDCGFVDPALPRFRWCGRSAGLLIGYLDRQRMNDISRKCLGWSLRISLLLLMCLAASALYAFEPTRVVKVVGYTFPPFVERGSHFGITQKFLNFLNESQTAYRFKFTQLPADERYDAVTGDTADMIIFEMPAWGWQKFAAQTAESRVILTGGEVYVARNAHGRSQSYFDQFHKKVIAVVKGYHYGFAGFNADSEWLKHHFSVVFVDGPGESMRKVIDGEADIAIVSRSFLSRFSRANPDDAGQLIISERMDQEYQLRAIFDRRAKISVREFNAILGRLHSSGDLKRFFTEAGLGNQLAITW